MINRTQPFGDLTGIRFGVLLSSTTVEAWQEESIRQLIHRGARLVVVAMDDTPCKPVSLRRKLGQYDWSRLLFNLYYRFVFRLSARRPADVSGLLHGVEIIRIRPTRKGISNYFAEADVAKLRGFDADFLLRFGFGILRGDVLNVARQGVWSFHHGDEQLYRGSPPGLWEIWRGDPVTGVILQRLTDRLDDGHVLHKGWFRTIDRSWSDHLNQLLWGAADWPARCAAALKNGVLRHHPARSEAPVLKPPCNAIFVAMLMRMAWNRLRFHAEELFRAEDWNIAIQPAADPDDASGQPLARWLPKVSRSVFAADPFLVTIGDTDHVWFEEYNCHTGRGRLTGVTIGAMHRYPQQRNVLLEEPFHLSFPSVLQHEGQIYCIPESFSARQVRLYRLQMPEMKLELDTVLIDHWPGVDPVVWFDGRLWWLFCTAKEAPSIHLFLFYADNLRGPYQPHPLNPVKSDLRGSRMAGPLYVDKGQLYRPAQDCSVHYGRRVVINRIETLTTTDFSETVAGEIEPLTVGGFREGVHTFGFNSRWRVTDGKRFVFVAAVFRAKFSEHFKRLFNHV